MLIILLRGYRHLAIVVAVTGETLPLKLIVNSVLADTASVKVTDTADVDQTAESAAARKTAHGGRAFALAQSGTAARRYVMINTAGGLEFDTFAMIRADRHYGKAFKLLTWSDYPATSSAEVDSATWTPTLCGANDQDAIIEDITATNKEAVGIELGSVYAKEVSRMYFGIAFAFSYLQAPTLSPFWQRVQVGRQSYLCSELINIRAEALTRSQLNTFENLYHITTDPCVLYDSSAVILPDKLWHVIIPSYNVRPRMNDFHDVDFTAYRLRAYA